MHLLQTWALGSGSLRVWSGSGRRHIDQTHPELSGPHIWVLAQTPGLTLQPQSSPLKIGHACPVPLRGYGEGHMSCKGQCERKRVHSPAALTHLQEGSSPSLK